MKTYNQLLAENERLRRALSPAVDAHMLGEVEEGMKHVDLRSHVRVIRGEDHVAVLPSALYQMLYNKAGSVRDVRELGRCMDALGWQRYVYCGVRYFVLPMGDYINTRDW